MKKWPFILIVSCLSFILGCGGKKENASSHAGKANPKGGGAAESLAEKSLTVNLYYKGENGNAQKALDLHHASPMMRQLAELREKYDLHMTVERFVAAEEPEGAEQFIRK